MSVMIKATTTCAVAGQTRKATVPEIQCREAIMTRKDSLRIHGYISEYIDGEYRYTI